MGGNQEIKSDAPASVIQPAKSRLGGMTQVEARAKAQERQLARLARLERQLTPRAFAAVKSVPSRYINRLLRALTREASYKGAVEAKCEECVGYEFVREEVGDCKATTCPLHAYRPYQPKG